MRQFGSVRWVFFDITLIRGKPNMAQDDKRPRGEDTIDANLKRVYQETLEEEVPDRFKELLAQLKAQDSAKDSGGDATQ